MQRTLLKSKLHGATVTQADMHYEGSISIDRELLKQANMLPYEKVDIYNITNGNRFSTYIIEGGAGEIGLNGAAARLVQVGDQVIIATFANYFDDECIGHKALKLIMGPNNTVKEIIHD
ncbi:MAG: aspartate 1-decarboxylase [Candidatus Marinimicrobia bacterium]|nr:aspartate 1-decarboxylase [Candidatus Neomarinimicrobiota bacterium]